MNCPRRPSFFRAGTRLTFAAFTLVELLVVVAIMALIAALVTPAATSIVRGSAITQSGDIIGGELSLARQAALSRNHSVEVRFYQFSDPEIPGEAGKPASLGKYRAIQIFEMAPVATGSAAFTYVPLDKMRLLPQSVIIDSGAVLSTLIATGTATVPTPATGAALHVPIPRAGINYNASLFHIRSDGSTDLPKAGALWFITLHTRTDGDQMTSPPPNFCTVQIDPFNAHLKTFRP